MAKTTFASVDESVAHTQGLFATAGSKNEVLRTKKQYYAVHIRKITNPDGETVKTKENREPGQQGKCGDWVLTRVDAAGQPVKSKDGGNDTWCAAEKSVLKTYTVGDDVLAKGEGVVYTKTGNIVHMVLLTEDIQIQTSWGPMDGKAGDFLPNYNYDEATGTAGDSYAIVAADSWDETYEPADEATAQTLARIRS